MSPEEISVIIPTRNRAHMVAKAIDSVLDQGVDGLEVIVVDDDSRDNTASALAAYAERIRMLRLTESKGVAHARNKGVAMARGHWLAFLDSDDVWLPGKLAAQLELIGRDDGIALCFGDYLVEEVDEDGHWREVMVCGRRPGPRDFPALFRRNFIGTSTVLLRRDCFLSVGGFDESLHRGSDYDLWLRVAAVAPVQRVPGVYTRYRRHAQSLTGLDPQRDLQTWAEVTGKWLQQDPQLLQRVGWTQQEWQLAASGRGEA